MERNVACILRAPAASHSPAGSRAEQSSQLQAIRVCLRACPSKGPTCQSNQINVNVVGKSSEAIPWACPMSRTGLTEKRAGWRAIRVVNLQFGRGGRPDLHGLGPGIISISGSQFLHRLKKSKRSASWMNPATPSKLLASVWRPGWSSIYLVNISLYFRDFSAHPLSYAGWLFRPSPLCMFSSHVVDVLQLCLKSSQSKTDRRCCLKCAQKGRIR